MATTLTEENREHEYIISCPSVRSYRVEMRRQGKLIDKVAIQARKISEGVRKDRERKNMRYKDSQRKKMEAIAGPGIEIKAVLHEINGSLHKKYMNHTPHYSGGERERQKHTEESRAAGLPTTTSKVFPLNETA